MTYEDITARADAINEGTTDAVRPGPGRLEGTHDAVLAEMLEEAAGDSSWWDEEAGSVDEEGYWVARIGRFIVDVDDRGFFDYGDFGTEEAARDFFVANFAPITL